MGLPTLSVDRIGKISFALSSVEALCYIAAITLVQTGIVADHASSSGDAWVMRVIGSVWIICGPLSVLVALAGIAFDAKRVTACLALLTGVVIFVLCGTQMLV